MRDVKDEGNGGFYDDLFTKSSLFPEKLHPKEYASHEISISARADNGSCMIFKSSAVSPFCKTATARGVTSSLVLKSALNPLFHSSLRFSSDSVLHLQSQLNITPNTRVTFEAQESASDKAPTSFAKIGGDYRGKKMFADVKVDAVNGPTVEGCYGVLYGGFTCGMMGAYDVGLDYSDGIGRFSKLNLSTVYSKDDFSALLEVTDKGKCFRLDINQIINPQLRLATEVAYDRRKDRKTLRVRSKYDFNTHETLYSSLGSDGVLVSALEWKLSNELKTRISTQMDVRNYDSDAHHFGISVEIL